MRRPVGRRLGVVALVLVLACVGLVVWLDGDPALDPLDPSGDAEGYPFRAGVGSAGLGQVPGGLPEPPRTLSFGAAEVVQMPIGQDAWAPVAIAVHAIRRGDAEAVDRVRRGLSHPRHVYYADVTLTFEGLGVVHVVPFLTLAQGSRDENVHHYRIETQRPFPPCPGAGDGVTLRAGEPVDVCVVFPGPRPERVRGISILGEPGDPTWEGSVS